MWPHFYFLLPNVARTIVEFEMQSRSGLPDLAIFERNWAPNFYESSPVRLVDFLC